MPDHDRLRRLLDRLDGRSWPAYRDLEGAWRLGDATLIVDHVQGDPYAAPSRVRWVQPSGLPARLHEDPDACLAAEDWLLRRFGRELHGRKRGSGRSGQLRVYRPGPEILERSAVRLRSDGQVEVRFAVGLPGRGRRVLGRQAWALLTENVPEAAAGLGPHPDLDAQVRSVLAQRTLRRQLADHGLVAFVADGAVLPRASGIDPAPLPGAVPFESPPELQVTLDTPDGPVSGMGVPEGTTLIVGGGFHGKSTLLLALQHGHLDHVPGDGRERVVALPDTVKVRAEDGRRVCRVDISAFLGDLPGGRSTAPFDTEDASGSTSQAAAIVEAVEAGARVLLLDEDTSATNLLVRDERMRALIPRQSEPITPFVERVRQLREGWGISVVMVVGGVGDYLAVADTVIAMHDFRPEVVTERAHALAPEVPESPGPLPALAPRVPLAAGLEPDKVRARDERRLRYGGGDVELSAVEQILDAAQAATVGEALRFLHGNVLDGQRTLATALDSLDAILDDEGVEVLSRWRHPEGDLVRPRRHEIAAALDRVRTLRIRAS